MKKMHCRTWLVLLLVMAVYASALAGVPQTINYQGYLKNGGGVPVSSPTNISFRLYSSTRPSSGVLWSEERSVTPVNGVYSVELGSSTPFGTLPFDTPYFLGIAAGADPEMTPRQPLTSAPYALRAGTAENAGSAMTIAGQDLTQLDSRYIDPAQPARPSPLQIATMRWDQVGRSGKFTVGSLPVGLAFDGANIWTTNVGSNNVTKLRASDGAVFGSYPLSAAVIGMAFDGANIWAALFYSGQVAKIPITAESSQPYIASGAIASAMIADTAVTTAKIADGSVTTAKLAANAATTAVIADGAVTYSKISGPIRGSKISTTVHSFGGNPGASIAGGNYSAGSISNTAGRSSFAVTATIVPGAGSWEVGFCVWNSGLAALDNNNCQLDHGDQLMVLQG